MHVSRITFDELKAYWIEVDHFRDPDKRFREVVRRLGPYCSQLADPRRYSYGLIEGEKLVGVTHLAQWSDTLVRYRTLNVRKSHRGRDLGAFLLARAVDLDWQAWKAADRYLFGWVRRDHHLWACGHDFKPLDGQWHGDHIAMIKPLDEF